MQCFGHQRARALQDFAAHAHQRRLELCTFPAVNMTQPMIAAPEHVGKQIFDALHVVVEMREESFDIVRNALIALDQRDGCTRGFEIQLGRILDALRLRTEPRQQRHLACKRRAQRIDGLNMQSRGVFCNAPAGGNVMP